MFLWTTKPVISVNFVVVEILASKSWINKLSIDVWFVRILQYTTNWIWNLRVQKNLNIENIAFKVVQIKSLAIHITSEKISFDILGKEIC